MRQRNSERRLTQSQRNRHLQSSTRILALSARPALLADAISLCAAAFGANSGYGRDDWKVELERILRHPVEEAFVAIDGDRVLGLACLVERETRPEVAHLSPWLSALAVEAHARGTGVAKALTDHVAAYAAAGGYQHLYALTEVPGLFFRLGWDAQDTARVTNRQVFVFRRALVSS